MRMNSFTHCRVCPFEEREDESNESTQNEWVKCRIGETGKMPNECLRAWQEQAAERD